MEIEVFCDIAGKSARVGTLHSHVRRNSESVSFEYHTDWFAVRERFALEPSLPLTRGTFVPSQGLRLFGSIGDSAPDTWGRRLMQRAERHRARREGRAVRTLMETDYLLGVADISRTGALRFRFAGGAEFQAPSSNGVPRLIDLPRVLSATERVLRDEESDEDLQLIFAPGSSLGGARPKASVLDSKGRLSIAKFPKENDDYPMERWEAVALRLAENAGIATPKHELIRARGKPVLLSRRFDRDDATRVPYLSALALLGLKDGDRGSYPELVDSLTQYGARAAADAHELFKRMTLNVLISNVDDHLRNHGFLRLGHKGWVLSPVFDLNPTPVDVRARILTTNITPNEGTCDLDLVLAAAQYFGLSLRVAKTCVRDVAMSVSKWRDTAKVLGATTREIRRMASAFEHGDVERALKL